MNIRSDASSKAKQQLKESRIAAEYVAEQRKANALEQCPELKDLLIKKSSVGGELTMAHITGDTEKIKQLNTKLNGISAEISALLVAKFGTVDYLEPHYMCRLCNDTGYINGKPCECIKKLTDRLVSEQFDEFYIYKDCSFETFDINYYPEDKQKKMAEILQLCRDYVQQFKTSFENILFTGATGLGKTHLSMAIARALASKGYYVIYSTAYNLLKRIEDDKFGRTDNDAITEILECDLLVIDDLGTEFLSPFSKSAVYDIINTRLLYKRPTVISTNLSIKELQTTYDARTVSRIVGYYTMKGFEGSDVRLLKRKENK